MGLILFIINHRNCLGNIILITQKGTITTLPISFCLKQTRKRKIINKERVNPRNKFEKGQSKRKKKNKVKRNKKLKDVQIL